MSDDADLRRSIVRALVASLQKGKPETCILGVPFGELESVKELARDTAEELGVEIEMTDRVGDHGLVHLDLWRADIERSGILGDMAPPV